MLRPSGGTVRAGEDRSLSPTKISPAEGSMKPAISRSVVVLPQPDGPSRQTSWPCSMRKKTSSTATAPPYRLPRPFSSTEATLPPCLHTLFKSAGARYIPGLTGGGVYAGTEDLRQQI